LTKSLELFVFLSSEMRAFVYLCMFGLQLQEPIALVTNWMIASFCFFAFFNLKRNESTFQDYWKNFYLVLGISMFFGGLGHLFFQYLGMVGKFPSWILGVIAGLFSSFAMLSVWPNKKQQNNLKRFVILKSILLLSLSIATRKFLFVAIDTSVAYLIFCGFLAYKLIQKNFAGMRYILIGVLVLLPSVLIYGCKINLHRYLNKDDLSHLFMVGCIIMFYIGVKRTDKNQVLAVAN
jgi:hypothetical protein